MSLPRLLVIDDEPTFLLTAEGILADDFRVETATAAREAIERAVPGVDVICADFRMPDMDGVSALELARSRDPGVECVLITGFGEMTPEARTRLDALGATFLRKPVDPALFLDVLRNLADAARLRRARSATA